MANTGFITSLRRFSAWMCVCYAGMKKTVLTPLYALGEAMNWETIKRAVRERSVVQVWIRTTYIIEDNGCIVSLMIWKGEQSKMKTSTARVVNFEAVSDRSPVREIPSGIPRMKTIKEITELTGLSYTLLRNLCLENKIVHIRAGKKYLINYDRFVDYLNGVGGA